MDEESTGLNPETAERADAVSPTALRRRRLWLYALVLLGLVAVAAVTLTQIKQSNDRERAQDLLTSKPSTSVVLERFELRSPAGVKAQGLVELVRRQGKTSLRMIAVRLRPSVTDEVYQVSLAGGAGDDRLLGGQAVGRKGTFLARADVSSEELHRFKTIEIRRVGSNTSGKGKLVLRANIPG